MDYAFPLDRLLTLGQPKPDTKWSNYPKAGLGPQHVSDLIRMATDPALNQADAESQEVWAPVHAWRALGQLRATAAVGPLLALLDHEESDDDDWALEDVPQTLGLIGPTALPELTAFLSDHAHQHWARMATAEAVRFVAENYPEAADECIAILARELAIGANSREFNGFLVADLLDLKAVAAAPHMEEAFAAGRVDETIAGDWNQARYELGLGGTPPAHWEPADLEFIPVEENPEDDDARRLRERKTKAKAKAKRKQADKARKRNRKK